jgi:hypothetical protein
MGVLRMAVAAIFLAGFAAPALAQNYECSLLETGERSNWIAPDMQLSMSKDGQSAKVIDGLIQHFVGKPIDAKVVENTDARLVVRWSVDMVNEAVQTTRMAYRATVFKDTNKIRVHARPNGYPNDFEGRGDCKLR